MNQDQQEPIGFTVSGIVEMAGGRAAVARGLGVAIQTVNQWKTKVPPRHARKVAIMAGLPLEIVRPDMVRTGHAEALAHAQEK